MSVTTTDDPQTAMLKEDDVRPFGRNLLIVVAGLAVLSIMVSACDSGTEATEPPSVQEVEHTEDEAQQEEHTEEEEHENEGEEHAEHSPEDHMEGSHDVPEDAASVPNPFADDEESPAAGAELYAAHCALCHGETGEGDGPGASGLQKPPADLHEGHVQGLTDGALFYIISHGKPDTPMPAWENLLDEDQRWHVVNFLRTFGDN
ncbi:MAG: c-type cytochrome [Nitrospiraceae bacterium]